MIVLQGRSFVIRVIRCMYRNFAVSLTFPVLLGVTPALRTRAISIPISCSMRKIAKGLKSAYAWSRSLSCRIVLKLHFQLFNNVDRFSQWVAISQEDMSKQKCLTGGMQRAGCRTVVFRQQNKGSV